MARASVLIGVNRTGKLPPLNDAVSGARQMERWALAQGMTRDRVLVFTDENGPVDISDIRRGIRKLVDSGSVTQLIIYFAGHGVNIRYGEYWLLSEAPQDPSAAVNVEGSMVLARRCGIPHVVFISDACRTAAEGVQAQGITGGEIFPNEPLPGLENPVDIFFSTTLGRPALEIRDADLATASFKAIYTSVLVDAFSGALPRALTPATLDGQQTQVVRPRPLKIFLNSELPQRLSSSGLPFHVSQIPDARITSDDTAWLARVDGQPVLPPEIAVATTVTRRGPPGSFGDAPTLLVRSPMAQAQERLDSVLHGDALLGATSLRRRRGSPSLSASPTPDVPPTRFGTGCGFKIEGATLAECAGINVKAEIVEGDPSRVEVGINGTAVNVLLRLADGSGLLLPAFRGFVGTVSIADGEVTDVAYEPPPDTPLWDAFAPHAGKLRELRTVIADLARDNFLRLDLPMAKSIFARMHYDGHFDPTLVLHCAYAFGELRMHDQIRLAAASLQKDLGAALFDLELLAGNVRPDRNCKTPLVPRVPLLARGWSLLSAYGATLHPELAGLHRRLLPSLWTHFDAEAAARLRDLILTRRLQ